MDTPPPASSPAARSHRKQKVLRSNEILGKRRQHIAANGEENQDSVTSHSPLGTTVYSPLSSLVIHSPTVPLPKAVTPATTGAKKRSGEFLRVRTHAIRRRKGIVLDDTKILGFLREPFTSVLKSSGKAMIDAKGLKRIANSNFELSFTNPGSISKSSRHTSPTPTIITQSQSNPENEVPVAPPVSAYNLPHVVPSHGTVEMRASRRYLLEDIMMAPVGESLILMVSTRHPWYSSYKSIADRSSPLPLAMLRDEPFIQVTATVAVNCQLADLEHGTMIQTEIEGLLFGNGNGAVILYFPDAEENLQVLWKEFFDNVDTISVWGSRPMKRRLYDALHNLSNLDSRKALFQRLANEICGDRSLTYDLASAMSKKAVETSNSFAKRSVLEAEKEQTLSLDPKLIKPFSQYVDSVVMARMQTAYGEFVSLTDPILTHKVIDGMVNECERQLPHHWKKLQSILGFDNSFKKTNVLQPLLSKEYLRKFYRRMTLYAVAYTHLTLPTKRLG